jgi:hypothetical protein
VPVVPTYPSDKGEVADITGLNPCDLDVKNGKVYLKKCITEKIAKELLNVCTTSVNVLPVFSASASPNGFIAEVSFTLSGKKLLALYPEEINLIGMVSPSTGKLFGYVNKAADFADGKFTLRLGGVIFNGEIDPDETYELVAFIKDGGEFDLDGLVNGKIVSSVFLASEKECIFDCFEGCNAGYGYLVLAMLGAVPIIFKKRK